MGEKNRRSFYKQKQLERPPKEQNIKAVTDSSGILNVIKGKKVLSFIEDSFDCCSQKMVIEYTPHFEKLGYASLIIPTPNFQDVLKYLSKYAIFFRTGNHPQPPGVLESLQSYIPHLKMLGIRCVYYLDDFLMHTNNNWPLKIMQLCDYIIVSNNVLKEYLVKNCGITAPIYVVLTHMDLANFDKLGKIEFATDKFKILFTSQGRIGINIIYDICEAANEDPELYKNIQWIFNAGGIAQVRSVVNKFRKLNKVYLDWLEIGAYYSMCKGVDLICNPASIGDLNYMVAPEHQQTWLDCKSAVKYTLAGANRIPIISSPMYSYTAAIKHGDTGYIAETSADFLKYIRLLQNDVGLRNKIGEAARQDIEKNYDISHRFPEYLDALAGLTEVTNVKIEEVRTCRNLFIPPIEGGPRSFYENMKKYLPIVSEGKWQVTENLNKCRNGDAAVAIAFIAADQIIKAKTDFGIKIIYRLDGLPMDFQGNLEPTNLVKMQEMFKHADYLVWQSQHCLKMWTDNGLIPEFIPSISSPLYKGTIIHNGVDITIFNSIGNKYEFPKGRKNVLNMNWSTFPHKRVDLLIEIVKLALTMAPELQFQMLGNYKTTNPLANMGMWKEFSNVTYIGAMRNQTKQAKELLASIYRASDLLLFTSEMEGSPNTVLEAVGCGVPIAYNSAVDIVPEICGTQCTGWKTPEDFFTNLHDSMGAIPVLEERFTMTSCVKKYLEVLQ